MMWWIFECYQFAIHAPNWILFDVHDFFECFTKFRIENGINDGIDEAIHISEPCGEYKCCNAWRTLQSKNGAHCIHNITRKEWHPTYQKNACYISVSCKEKKGEKTKWQKRREEKNPSRLQETDLEEKKWIYCINRIVRCQFYNKLGIRGSQLYFCSDCFLVIFTRIQVFLLRDLFYPKKDIGHLSWDSFAISV